MWIHASPSRCDRRQRGLKASPARKVITAASVRRTRERRQTLSLDGQAARAHVSSRASALESLDGVGLDELLDLDVTLTDTESESPCSSVSFCIRDCTSDYDCDVSAAIDATSHSFDRTAVTADLLPIVCGDDEFACDTVSSTAAAAVSDIDVSALMDALAGSIDSAADEQLLRASAELLTCGAGSVAAGCCSLDPLPLSLSLPLSSSSSSLAYADFEMTNVDVFVSGDTLMADTFNAPFADERVDAFVASDSVTSASDSDNSLAIADLVLDELSFASGVDVAWWLDEWH